MKDDIRKFGSENFKREILFDFETQKEMDDKEKELVTEEFVKREDTYNVRVGGQDSNISDICSLGGIALANKCKMDKTYRETLAKKKSLNKKMFYQKHPEKKRHIYFCDWTGKHHTEDSKRKIGEKNKRMVGELNSNWGMVWIYNESLEQNKKVKKEQADDFLKQGWKLGRRMNFHK